MPSQGARHTKPLLGATQSLTLWARIFTFPMYWGVTSSVSADGTRWDVYENNLLAEYHVRYGNYGGIGYYHVADTYIAFFSRFISCGVFEGHHILDPFFQNKTDVKPDTVHSDTHDQSLAILGLSFLLGIKLMPRIAKWKNLKIFKSDFESYKNIDPVFSKEKIDWELIHLFCIRVHMPGEAPGELLYALFFTGVRNPKAIYCLRI